VRDVPAGVPDQVADVYVTFNPSQIKSADPVTYDDNGNIIPLSQRFDSRSEDIRNPKRKLKPCLRRNPATQETAPKHYESVNTFREYWNALGVRNMTEIRGKGTPYEHIRPSEIQVEKSNRNKGLGTAFMQDLTEFADRKGLQIRVNPSDELGATSKGRLEKFYKRFGFVENKPGRNKDYAISERFYRQPKRIAKRNPVAFPADDITFAAASPTPANLAIAAGKTLWDTPAFKKWFGDSKVKDLAGRPMVVYHGTCSAEFTEFDPTKTLEVGFHFGTRERRL
jgi:GNAT superfamily N-acetyltransferase